ncbi:unnamed protein product, partial [Amoebophrya sp. A25]
RAARTSSKKCAVADHKVSKTLLILDCNGCEHKLLNSLSYLTLIGAHPLSGGRIRTIVKLHDTTNLG